MDTPTNVHSFDIASKWLMIQDWLNAEPRSLFDVAFVQNILFQICACNCRIDHRISEFQCALPSQNIFLRNSMDAY